MNNPKYQSTGLSFTLPKLRQLMVVSDGYQALKPNEKANIEDHIRLNNTPVLIYIYQKLQEEQQSNQISRDRLAKKILKSTQNPKTLQTLQKTLKQQLPTITF